MDKKNWYYKLTRASPRGYCFYKSSNWSFWTF